MKSDVIFKTLCWPNCVHMRVLSVNNLWPDSGPNLSCFPPRTEVYSEKGSSECEGGGMQAGAKAGQ